MFVSELLNFRLIMQNFSRDGASNLLRDDYMEGKFETMRYVLLFGGFLVIFCSYNWIFIFL